MGWALPRATTSAKDSYVLAWECCDVNTPKEKAPPQANVRLRSGDRTAEIVAFRDQGLLLWEIAEWAGVTKERIRQILARATRMGAGPRAPKQVVTRQALILLGISAEMRPGSFQRLMVKFGVTPAARKRGRLYWNVESLSNIKPPRCVVCQSPVPIHRYARSVTCSRNCSIYRRSQYSSRRRDHTLAAQGSVTRTQASG